MLFNVNNSWAIVSHTEASSFNTVTGPLTITNFDDIGSEDPFTQPAVFDDVSYTFSSMNGLSTYFKIYSSPFLPFTEPNVLSASKVSDGTLAQGTTTLVFPAGTRAAGLYLIVIQGLNPSAFPGSEVTVEDFEGNFFTEYVEFQGLHGEQRFIGFHSLSGISSITFTSAEEGNISSSIAMDNVSYGDIVFNPVDIDIRPGSNSNNINIKSKGIITVAILTTESFDATTVDLRSVMFGIDEAKASRGKGHIEDVDSDGDLDLLLRFRIQESGFDCGDLEAGLTGETFGGPVIEGFDSINIVGCH
jgi:hypothetical protein